MLDPQLHPKTQRHKVQGIVQEVGHSITPLKQINHIYADRHTIEIRVTHLIEDHRVVWINRYDAVELFQILRNAKARL